MKPNRLENYTETSYFRLIEATTAHWEICGFAGMSARQISLAAGAPVSSIYHHFGSLEHLFLTSQQHCLERAGEWCETQFEQAAGLELGLDAFGEFFAHIVDEWTEGCRPLAFAWRECALLAARSEMFVEQSARWRSLWSGFWERAGALFALGRRAVMAERMFDSESLLHMIRWRRAVDRAALSEFAHGLAEWLAGRPAPAAPWREQAYAEILRASDAPVERDSAAIRVMRSAAELVGDLGVAGVTHRAVAERAGLTLGVVSYKFRSKSDLLNAAFEGLYTAMTEQDAQPQHQPKEAAEPGVRDIIDALLRVPRMAGSDDLIVAAARDPALSGFGAQLRYLRGRSSRAALQAVLGARRTASPLEGAMFSAFLSAQLWRRSGRPDEDAAAIKSEYREIVALLVR